MLSVYPTFYVRIWDQCRQYYKPNVFLRFQDFSQIPFYKKTNKRNCLCSVLYTVSVHNDGNKENILKEETCTNLKEFHPYLK